MGVQSVYGGDVAWVSDIDPGANKILAHRFPDVPNLGDITTVDWSQVEPVDVLCGGFPCQDVSAAGKRAGIRPGTRSGLWTHFAYAIAQLRPRTVVIENVRGLLSARAHSDVEPCAWCVGDDTDGALRALGAVLGDLASLGYDASWHGVRAADVGAPHGRFRVFVVATDTQSERRAGGKQPLALVEHDGSQPAHAGASGGALTLLPTPTVQDGANTGGPSQYDRNSIPLNALVTLLPTPAVNDMGAGKTPEAWDEWTAKMQAEHGNGNGHGKSLAIEAQRLLPTPSSADGLGGHERRGGARGDELLLNGIAKEIAHANTTEGRSSEGLRGVRDGDDSQEVREATGGPDALSGAEDLLAGLREHAGRGDQGRAALEGQEAQGPDMSGLRHDGAPTRSPRGPEPREQRPGQPDDALRELSPETALARGQGGVDWGAYAPAIRRWELILGRPAPLPTMLSTKGSPQLSPRFVEFLMGLPAGWVTGVPGITRNEALKALGNGVVPQQAAAALAEMATWAVVA